MESVHDDDDDDTNDVINSYDVEDNDVSGCFAMMSSSSSVQEGSCMGLQFQLRSPVAMQLTGNAASHNPHAAHNQLPEIVDF